MLDWWSLNVSRVMFAGGLSSLATASPSLLGSVDRVRTEAGVLVIDIAIISSLVKVPRCSRQRL